MGLVKKGTEFIAGGTAKRFKVDSVEHGIVTATEQDVPDPEGKREPEVIHTTENNILNSDDVKGLED